MKTVLGIFCKPPIPGHVKTRLAGRIGNAAAARLYEAFLTDVVHNLRTANDHRILCYATEQTHSTDDLQRLAGSHYQLLPQSPGNLGDRLNAFFATTFLQQADRVIVVGSDSPTISPADVEQAAAALDDADAVLGRSEDGGYYLIGLRRTAASTLARIGRQRPSPSWGERDRLQAQRRRQGVEACGSGDASSRNLRSDGETTDDLFAGIDWSTSAVYDQQTRRLTEAGLTCRTLPPIPEVDTPADLDRLRDHPLLSNCPHTVRVLSEIPRR